MKNIPLVDLKDQYKAIKPEINRAIKQILNSAHFILGEETEKFEKDFADYCGAKFAVGVGNGLAALELGMRALGIGPGDEVITPANSFIASSSAISFTGAKPVLADCDEATFNLDPTKIEEKISKRTKAIMPVHLYGQPADMDKINKIAQKHHLFVVEDACQAHGAKYKDKRTGSLGTIAAFSFYPGKNLGAYGDGGALVTNNKSIADKIAMMRNYGQKEKYHHVFLAWNSRLDNLQSAILSVKLKHLDKWNKTRQERASLYGKLLEGLPIILPPISEEVEHVFHLYVIRTKKRDELASFLQSKGISTGLHYPIPIHLQTAYKDLGHKKGDFPITEKLANEILSLPMYPELSKKDVTFIANTIKKFFS